MTTTMATAMRWKKNRETPCIAGANATDHSIITPEIIDVASNKLSTARAMPRQPARDKYKRRIAEILEVIMWLATFEGVHNAYVQVHHIMGTTAIMYAFIYLIMYIYMCVCVYLWICYAYTDIMHTNVWYMCAYKYRAEWLRGSEVALGLSRKLCHDSKENRTKMMSEAGSVDDHAFVGLGTANHGCATNSYSQIHLPSASKHATPNFTPKKCSCHSMSCSMGESWKNHHTNYAKPSRLICHFR